MKKNFVSSHLNSNNHKKQANRKTRSLQMEALENRHLLSAASIMQTAIANDQANDTDACKEVNQNTFTVQSNLDSNYTDKVVAVYIQGNSDATFRLKDGDSATILSQVRDSENQEIACLLVKMGAKSSFTLTTDTPMDGPMTVFVTHPLDQNGDGQATEQEYYQVQGSYLNSLGMNQRMVAMFYKQHGIDLTTLETPTIFDQNGDGKIDQNEWQLAADIQDASYQISPTITTTPQIENLQVAGDSGTPVPGQENRFVSNVDPSTFEEDPEVTFTLPESENLPVKVVIEYVDSEGNEQTLTEEDVSGQTDVSIPLEGGLQPNSTVTITFSYNGMEESETTYTYVFDSVAPALDVASQLTSDYNVYEGMVYTNDPTPEFQISPSGEIDWDAVLEEATDPDKGIWLVVTDDQTEVYRKKLTNSDLTKLQNDEFFVTLPKLANGSHTLSFYTEDLAGNQTTGSQEELTIDTVKPVVAAEGHNVNYGSNSMYVETPTTQLEITVTDENLMFQDVTGCVTMTSDRGASADPTETDTTDSSIQYSYSLSQSYGTNVWTFTVVDAAGNQSVKTFTYDYNKPPQVTNKGTKLQDADVRLTTDSTTASDYESQQTVGAVTDGELNLGKVADLFKEVDGSSVVADNVSVENLGDAVASWDINEEGEIVLTLASFNEGETATFTSEGIVITYTDEYNKSADISFDLMWTNDTEAPVAELDANDALIDKAENEYYYTGEDDLALTFTFTDFNTVEAGTIYVYGDDSENPILTCEKGESDQVEVLLESPVHNQAYTFRYDAKDNFGNEIEGALICTIFVDQKVDVEAVEFEFSGVNERDTDPTPTFEATFDALTEPATLVLYCDGTEVASVEVAVEAESAEITSSELAEDGIYTFTAKLVDAAGNEFTVSPADGLAYYFDTTAPTVAITNEAEDPTGVTSDDYTLTLDTQDAVSGVASIRVTQAYTDEEGNPQTKTYSSAKTFDSCDVTLFYGVNTFTYTATDAAGNTSEPSAEFSVVYNLAPEATGTFYNENEQKFVQTLSKSLCDENEQIKLDLTKYFDDEVIATLTGDGFTITGNDDQDAAVSACGVEEGFLVFTMTSGMEQGEPDRFSNVSFTLIDEYGKELAVSFDVTYLFDSFAPTIEPENLTVTASEDGNVTKNTDTLYFLTGDEINITATITDDTGIETCGWTLTKIVGEEATVVASGDTINVSYSETGIENGTQFVLTVWGKDTLVPANESTSNEPSCEYQFCVDNTAPTAESEAELQDSTGEVAEDQTLIADNQPCVAYEVQVNDMMPDCCKLSIFLDGELLGDDFDFTGALTNDTPLTDGVHRYTFQVVDGAGNESDVYSLIEFTVDTTAPVWTVTEVANAPAEEGDYGFLFLDENDSVEFDLEVEDNISALEDVAFQYSTDGGETWTDYVPGDGVALEFGTKTFQFKAIDEAGNESVSETTLDVSYDHTPTVTRAALEAKDPIQFVEDQTEYTVYFTASEISALFDDADLENGDALTFTCSFDGAEGVVTAYTWKFRNGVWNLKLTVDPAALKQSHTFGTLTSLTATDTFDQSVEKQVNLAIDKINLAPEQTILGILEDTQKVEGEPSYTFDLTDYFADPEGDEWTISAATINGDECAINGKSITWTPSEGLYGRTSLEITVKDQFNAETSVNLGVLIEWAGVQSVAARNQVVEENAAAQEVAVTIENAFDPEQAWGDYSCDMTNGISVKSETVYGNTVDDAHVQTPIETLFADYNFTDSTLTYSLNPYAYGEAVLTLSVNGVTTDVTITVTNDPCDPYAPAQTGSFTLTSAEAQEYNVLAQCNTDTDSGALALTSVNDNKTAITIFRDDKVYTLNLAVTEDGFTLTRGTIDGNAGTSEEWEALHGSTIVIPYEIQNTDTECTNTGNFIVKLNAIAKSVTKSYRRSDADEYYEIPLSEFTDFTEDGFKVVNLSFVRGSQDVSAGVNSEGGVGVSITAGCDVDTVYEYMLSNGTDTYYAQLYISIDGYNWAPELKPGVPTTVEEPEREPDATLGFVVYDCPIGDLFVDPVDDTDLTITLVGGKITDARTGEVYEDENIADFGFGDYNAETGVVWFSPFDKDFYGTIEFTVAVTDGAAGTKKAAAKTSEFTFTATITNTADAPQVLDGAELVLSGNPGDVFDLSEEVGKFYSPDGDDTLEVVYGDSTTYTIPEDAQFGSYTIEVTVNDTTNGLSQNFEYTVVVSGSAAITDDSLDVTKQKETTIQSGTALTSDKTLDQELTLTADATFTAGSVLKAGAVLKAGTEFAKNLGFQCDEVQDWFETYGFEEDDGEYSAGGKITLDEDITLTADITITNKSITAASGSTLAAGTVAAEGSKFGQTFTISETIADVTEVKKIYQASKKVFGLTGDRFVLLRDEISISVADPDEISSVTDFSAIGGAVQYVFDADASENDFYASVDFSDGSMTERIISIVDPEVHAGTISPFRFVTYDSETGKFYAYYTPYDSTQDRTAQTTVLTINGEDVDLTLSIDYEVPFEVCYTLAKGTDTRLTATSIAAGDGCEFVDPTATLTAGETYTVQMWVKCNLPFLSETLLAGKPYGPQSLIETAYFSLDNVTNVGTYGPSGASESTYDEGVGKLKLGVVETAAGKDFTTESYQIMYLTFTAGEDCALGDFARDLEGSTYSLILDNEIVSGVGACGGVNPETGLPDASAGVRLSPTQVKTRTLNPNAVKGTSAAKETVVEGNGIYMSFVKEKSTAQVSDTLPKSDAYITEWEGGFLELWVNTQEVETDIANFKFDVNYDSSLYTATGIEFGANVSNAGSVTFGNGTVNGITGALADAVTTEDGFVLIGRIQLTPVRNGGIAAETIGATSLGLSLENIELRDSEGFWLDVNTQTVVNTKALAVMYDGNDDGDIDIDDLVLFARKFGTNTVVSTDSLAWALDFDNNGLIDIQDLVFFARNFGATQANGAKIYYPNNYFQIWIGTTLEMSGDSNISDTLESAVNSWSEKLGEELNLDVQIIVKEYANEVNGTLAEASLLGCDEDGKPNTAVIYLDSDALGMGWYVGKDAEVQAEQYDLYTVLLHELGHALGMTTNYSGYNEFLSKNVKSSNYRDEAGNMHVVIGSHVYDENDLMTETIDVGVRREISDVDAEIVKATRAYGGAILGSATDSILGISAAVEGVTVTEAEASAIMPEVKFNQILIEAATKAVLEVAAKRVDSAWQELEAGENEEVSLSTAVTDDAIDSLFGDDFSSLTDGTIREDLKVEQDEE